MLKKVYVVSVSITAALVYCLWNWFSLAESPLANDSVCDVLSAVVRPIIFVLSSPTLFLITQKILLILIDRITCVKKLFFGKEYVEGYWVGYVEVKDGENYKPCFMIEEFEQTTTDICVYGKGYDETGDIYVTWSSSGHPVLLKGRNLAFAYTDKCYGGRYDASIYEGYSNYTLRSYKRNILRTPKILDGYIVNHTREDSTNKIAILKKIDNPQKNYLKKCQNQKKSLDKEAWIDEYLLSEAKKLWEDHNKRIKHGQDTKKASEEEVS